MAPAPRCFRPASFHDVGAFAEAFRAGGVVDLVLDLTSRDNELRLIDFASGLVLGVSGTMERVEPRHYRLTNPPPPDADAAGDREPRDPQPVSGVHAATMTLPAAD